MRAGVLQSLSMALLLLFPSAEPWVGIVALQGADIVDRALQHLRNSPALPGSAGSPAALLSFLCESPYLAKFCELTCLLWRQWFMHMCMARQFCHRLRLVKSPAAPP